ncbi:hypothetical protein EYF80_052030 [Liparis tanakae]|uniref:Uncharacterized protein n=1 Tax=Liparis tanakae TaxID=230148 RepID=A0A4Z2F9E2_9TELE|nr:hypothetical protein EYF80_052030 [Liparis tanakae]
MCASGRKPEDASLTSVTSVTSVTSESPATRIERWLQSHFHTQSDLTPMNPRGALQSAVLTPENARKGRTGDNRHNPSEEEEEEEEQDNALAFDIIYSK